MIELVFLGTSAMVPTKERNVQSIFLSYGTEGILIDCGEGTQRQMNLAGINRNRVTKILISHWHGDHVSGLAGLLQTLSSFEETKTVVIYGPKGTKKRVGYLLKAFAFDLKTLKIEAHDLNPKNTKKFLESNDFYLECASLDHVVPCLAYSFVEKPKTKIDLEKAKRFGIRQGPLIGKLLEKKKIKLKDKTIKLEEISYKKEGKKITFISDTAICNSCFKIAENADILVAESSYTSKLEEKAREYKHMTAQQAALIANKSNVKKLILTHFSQRYKTISEIEEEARTYFQNSVAAYDFMKLKL